MKTHWPARIPALLRSGVAGGALAYLLVFLAVAAVRVGYPFELEWMEGGTLAHVQRILAGDRLYVAPSLDFVPFIYAPLYYYLAAGAAALLGAGFAPLRLVSVAAALASFLLLFLLVRRETGSRWGGLLAAGLYAAAYRAGGAWLDLARVDTLFVALLLGVIAALRLMPAPRGPLLAGVLVTLAALTKQTALAMLAPAVLAVLLTDRRAFLLLAGTAAAALLASTLALDALHGGWYSYYTLDLPRRYTVEAKFWLAFWVRDILDYYWPLLLLLLPAAATRRLPGRTWLFYGCASVGMIGGAWAARLNQGGYNNVLLPAYAALALLCGLAAAALLARAPKLPPVPSVALQTAVSAACLLQLLLLRYDPLAQLPTADDRAAGQQIVAMLRAVPGAVFVPYHGYLAEMAGKPSFAHWMAMGDILGTLNQGEQREAARLTEELRAAIRTQRFAAIVLDRRLEVAQDEIEQAYRLDRQLFGDESVFLTVTGDPVRPQLLYLPRADVRP